MVFSTLISELKREATIVVIEDAHWADDATLDLIKYLGRRVQRTLALLIVTYRDDELSHRHPGLTPTRTFAFSHRRLYR